ncbi:MAG: hypothetical protein FWE45_04015 [Firmicutes bacterium]|nr:hypothetical protein [Bacillota bacterium]
MRKMQIVTLVIGLSLVTMFAIMGATGVFAGTPTPPPGPGTPPTPVTTPVESFRSRVQGTGNQVITQFTLNSNFTFGERVNITDEATWASHHNALRELALGSAVTTALNNDVVFFTMVDDQLFSGVRSGYWAGFLNIQGEPEARTGAMVTPVPGMTLEILENGYVFENSGGLAAGATAITAGTEWRSILMVIQNGNVFRHVVEGDTVGGTWASWASPVNNQGLALLDLNQITTGAPAAVQIDATEGTVNFADFGSFFIASDYTTIQFNLDVEMTNGDYFMFSLNTGTEQLTSANTPYYVMSSFFGVRMQNGHLYVAFASRDSRFALNTTPDRWEQAGAQVRRVANLNNIRITFSADYGTVSINSPTMITPMSGTHLVSNCDLRPEQYEDTLGRWFEGYQEFRTASVLRSFWLSDFNVADILVSNIRVA